jgi:ATPase subunit of ABC transporter with duplicated ATPase domains
MRLTCANSIFPFTRLSAQSVAWLESFLATFKGTVVAITHDR